MSEQTKPRASAVPRLILWTAAGMTFGYFVLGWVMRGPGDPFGQFVGTGFGGLIGLGLAIIWNRSRMIPAPKRRWFSYSLRTLFVVVTVLGCWLGWSLNRIHQRSQALRWIGEHQGEWGSFDSPPDATWEGLRWMPPISENYSKYSITRWLFRDIAVMFIGFPKGTVTVQDIEHLQGLFPEAFITFVPVQPEDLP